MDNQRYRRRLDTTKAIYKVSDRLAALLVFMQYEYDRQVDIADMAIMATGTTFKPIALLPAITDSTIREMVSKAIRHDNGYPIAVKLY